MFLAITPLIGFSDAQAYVYCMLIDELPALSDAETTTVAEALIAQHGGQKPFHVRGIDSGRRAGNSYYIAWQHDSPCTKGDCYYRILEKRSSEVRQLFAFRGNGSLVFVPHYYGAYVEWLKDHYGIYLFEGPDKAYTLIGVPHSSNDLFIESHAYETAKLPRCRP